MNGEAPRDPQTIFGWKRSSWVGGEVGAVLDHLETFHTGDGILVQSFGLVEHCADLTAAMGWPCPGECFCTPVCLYGGMG